MAIKKLFHLIALAALTVMLPSCGKSDKKYQQLSKEAPIIMATVDALGSTGMTPERFFNLFGDKFDKSDAARTEDGIVTLFKWKDTESPKLSGKEEFYCCAQFNFKNNPNLLTISDFGLVYQNPNPAELDKYYSIAVSEVESLAVDKWDFKPADNTQKQNCKYYLKDDELISVCKESNKVTISKTFH